MIERLLAFIRPILNTPIILRVRRNHGLEHATVHMLNRERLKASGSSSGAGFVLLGNVPTEKVEAAVHEALRRMRLGEHNLAVHPNCGTNLAAAGVLTTLAALLGLGTRGKRPLWERLPSVMVLMMLAVLSSQPVGLSLQRHVTTEGDPGDLEVVSITHRQIKIPFSEGPVTVHNVTTRQG